MVTLPLVPALLLPAARLARRARQAMGHVMAWPGQVARVAAGLAAAGGIAISTAPGVAHAASPAAGIYQVDGDESAIHLTDQAEGRNARLLVTFDPQGDGTPLVLAAPVTPTRTAPRRAGNPVLDDIVSRAAGAHRIDPALIHAVIAAESGYSTTAMSPKGAQGLMQLMPATARDYGVTDLFDPRQNVDAGAQHLRRLLDTFGQDTALALAAYNAGEGAVARHGGRVPPYSETQAYVPRVLQRYASLRELPRPKAATPVAIHAVEPASRSERTPITPSPTSPSTDRSTSAADLLP
jgi:soluble lytic murein transglycosylase-like protein